MLSLTDPILIHFQMVTLVDGPHDGEEHRLAYSEERLVLQKHGRQHRYYRKGDEPFVYSEVLIAREIGGQR